MADKTLTNPDNWVSVERLNQYHDNSLEEMGALLDGKQGAFQFSEIPTATAGNLGAIIQYTGTTTDDYTNGFFYKCVGADDVYSWENVSVQESGSGSDEYVAKSGDTMTGALTTTALTVGSRANNSTVGESSVAEGYNIKAQGKYSHAEGLSTTTMTQSSHAEGTSTLARGTSSHAEGYHTESKESYSHAEGSYSVSGGESSHAEGLSTTATGQNSHAEGSHTDAAGIGSHAEGRYTVAGYENQHVQGKYNDNKSTNAFEIGNGNASARSNALEVDWDGNLTASGDVTDGSGNKLSEKANAEDLSTVAKSGSYNDLTDKPTIPDTSNFQTKTGDTKDNTVSFTSDDTASPTSFTTIDVVASGEKHSSLMQKLSQAIKNIRWLNSNKRTTGTFDSKSDTVTFTTADVSSDSSATSWTSVSQLTSGLTHATLLNRISAMMKNTRYLYNNLPIFKYLYAETNSVSANQGNTWIVSFTEVYTNTNTNNSKVRATFSDIISYPIRLISLVSNSYGYVLGEVRYNTYNGTSYLQIDVKGTSSSVSSVSLQLFGLCIKNR